MKKDLLYLAVIAGLGYLLYKNSQQSSNATNTNTTDNTTDNTFPLPDDSALLGTCPTSFSIPLNSTGDSTLYSSIGGKYFRQSMGATIRSIQYEISLLEFKDGCNKFQAIPTGTPVLATLDTSFKSEKEKSTNFSGTLYRGIM